MKKYILIDLEFKDIVEVEVEKEVKGIVQSIFEQVDFPQTDNLISVGLFPVNLNRIDDLKNLIQGDLIGSKNNLFKRLKRKFCWVNRKKREYIGS